MIPQFIPYWGEEEKKAMMDVMDSGFINEGKVVRRFEKEFARYVGAKYCTLVTSGSIALYMALIAVQERVMDIWNPTIPTYQGIFIAHALKQCDYTPILYDVDEIGTLPKLSKNVFPIQVHSNGRIGSSTLIEDCCQATFHHTYETVSCYSFAPTKHMTMGQGGAICCDSKDIFEELTKIKDHGRTDRLEGNPPKDVFKFWGTNFKMTDFQAGFGLEQLKKLPKRYDRLHEIYSIYKDELTTLPIDFMEEEPKWFIDIYVDSPDSLIEHMGKDEIIAKRLHKPVHMQPEFESDNETCPIAEGLYRTGVFLPSSTNLDDASILTVCDSIKEFFINDT